MVKRHRYLSAMILFVGAMCTFGELVPYTFTGKVSSIIYRDADGEEIIDPSIDITTPFNGFLNNSCTYIFNIDALREGEYYDEFGGFHQSSTINESQTLEVEGDDLPNDSTTTTLNARLFYCELEDGALLSDFIVDDDSYMNFGDGI